MLPDDFIGGVLLEPLGAAIPGGDTPVRLGQKDRVVADAFDQEAETFFGVVQGSGRETQIRCR